MKKQPASNQEPATKPSAPDQASPVDKWIKSKPFYGSKAVAEIVTNVETGAKILIVTDLVKGARPRRFPLQAVDIEAMRRPIPEESPEVQELLQLVADAGRVVLKPRDQQQQPGIQPPQPEQ